MVYIFVFFITGRFEILQRKVASIGDFDGEYDTEEKQRNLLVECSKFHNETLELVDSIKKIVRVLMKYYLRFVDRCVRLLSMVYLSLYIYDMGIFCISFFNLRLVKLKYFFLSSLAIPIFQNLNSTSSFVLIAIVFRCFVMCFSSEIIRTASINCSQAIYNSKWYNLKRIDQRKMVLFMLANSQKDCGFIAGGFKVSLEMFMQVSITYDEIF
jgi:hypothetical protein